MKYVSKIPTINQVKKCYNEQQAHSCKDTIVLSSQEIFNLAGELRLYASTVYGFQLDVSSYNHLMRNCWYRLTEKEFVDFFQQRAEEVPDFILKNQIRLFYKKILISVDS